MLRLLLRKLLPLSLAYLQPRLILSIDLSTPADAVASPQSQLRP